MQGKTRRPHRLLRLVYPMCFSLILTGASCQTLDNEGKHDKKTEIQDLITSKLNLVKTLLDQGQTEQAWDQLRPLLDAHPTHALVLNMAGLTHLALSNPDEAMALFRSAYEQTPTLAIGLNLSSALIASGRLGKARQILEKLLERPQDSYTYRERLWHNLALTYDKEGDLKSAEKFYQRALRENPSYYLSHLQLANVYKRQKNQRQSLISFAKAARSCPGCFAPRQELAHYYLSHGKPQKAIALLQRFVRNKESPRTEKAQAQDLLNLALRVKTRQDKQIN